MTTNATPARVTGRLDGFTTTLITATDAALAREVLGKSDYAELGYTHLTVEVLTERGWVGIG